MHFSDQLTQTLNHRFAGYIPVFTRVFYQIFEIFNNSGLPMMPIRPHYAS